LYTSPAHGHPGWAQLRQQLSTAHTTNAFGEWPLIGPLAAELASIEGAIQSSGHSPFDRGAHKTFGSLIADLNVAYACLGHRLSGLVKKAAEDAAALEPDARRAKPPAWPKLIEATRPLRSDLLRGCAVVAGFDDALAAAESVADPGGYDRLGRRLDDLRAICEIQGRGWKEVAGEISRHFTAPDQRPSWPGEFDPATPADEILESLRARLEPLPVEQEWAVWIGALAGPGGANDRFPSLVSGPVAVCGLPCGEDVEQWLREAQASLTMAFREAGLEPPPDVNALGEPIRAENFELYSAAELWGSLARPASFVARVAVSARSLEHAVWQAETTIRALYGMDDARVGRDLRSKKRVWTPQGMWWSGSVGATDRAEGEVYATKAALRAAFVWARGLRSPLSDVDMERLAARSLVRDPDASSDVRLARAFSSLEGLKARELKLEEVPARLWYRDAWDRAHRLADGAVGAVSGFLLQSSLPDEAGRQKLNKLQGELNTTARERPARERLRLAAAAADMLGAEHPHRRFFEDSVAALDDRARFSAERAAHAAAFARARRHRNFVVHGHRLLDAAIAPSVEFLTRLLEVALDAEEARDQKTHTACLGSLRDPPDLRRQDPRTFGALLDTVSAPHTVPPA
jgi:hypothetical protein